MMNNSSRPITQRRLQRMAGVLARRQPDVAVVIEDVTDPHNVSAVLRSCDATGVASAHLLYPDDEPPKLSKGVSASAQRWLDVYRHATVDACIDALRADELQIYATYLGQGTVDLYELDLTKPCAFVFGNERLGVSDAVLERCDGRVKIPMQGMVESLNISVAAAVTLYEMFRQRHAAGLYDRMRWQEQEIRARLRDWLAREGRDPAQADEADLGLELPAPVDRTRNS